MAKFKKHLEIGAIVGTLGNIVLYIFKYFHEKAKNRNHKFNWGEFISTVLWGCALGALTGIAADKFEPAAHPNHRGFFHSYLIWILAGWGLLQVISGNKERIWMNFAIIGFAGYSSHLIIDSQTPKSLPILGI